MTLLPVLFIAQSGIDRLTDATFYWSRVLWLHLKVVWCALVVCWHDLRIAYYSIGSKRDDEQSSEHDSELP